MSSRANELHDALGISTRALVDLSALMPRIKASMATCSAHLQDFIAIIDHDAADGALCQLALEVSASASRLDALCRDADATCVTARDALLAMQGGVRQGEMRDDDIASIRRSCDYTVGQLETIQRTIAAAQRQLRRERDLLLELARLHGTRPRAKAIAAAAVRRMPSP